MGTLLDGRYRVGPRIARGGMATVYEATDTRLDRVVAVKVLHAGYAEDESFAYRFVREARSAAKLAHPHVVGVFDQGEDDGTLFLAMEYVPGCTLRDVIREQGPLSPTRALALLEPILSALAAAHDAGIVHRDVKPENVLLTDDGRVKVADFGLARAVTTTTSTATRGMLIGTVSYVAPELVMDGAADARSDVYSAGVVLYEMLTGRKPHQGETPIQVAYKHVHEDVPPPSELVDGVPEYLDALVARATARRRDTRPADAKVLLHQLRRVRHALDHGVYDDPELTQDLSPASRHEDGPEPTVLVSTWADQNEPTATWLLQDPEGMHDGAGDDTRDGKGATYSHRRSRKRLVGWVTLAVVLVLAAVAGVGGWYFSVGRYTNTPDLTGMTVVQARQQLRSTQLTLHKGSSAYSETVPAGDIISTDPDAGDRLLREGTVSAVVSKGKERYPMPSVVGVSEDQARTALTSGHLAVGEVTDSYNAKVEQGLVVSASKEVGDSLRPDTRVDLVVSKGPRPIDVPDLVGQSSGDARGTLTDLGLKVDVSRRYDDSAPKGTVLAQNPSEGTLFRGDSVNLVVSKGAQLTTVPSVWGQDANTATATLQSAGFIVSVQHAEGYVGFDRVASQDPGANELAPVGSTVTIYLY